MNARRCLCHHVEYCTLYMRTASITSTFHLVWMFTLVLCVSVSQQILVTVFHTLDSQKTSMRSSTELDALED